jgi:hypothetical protein
MCVEIKPYKVYFFSCRAKSWCWFLVAHEHRALFATLPLAAAALSIISSRMVGQLNTRCLKSLVSLGGHETNAGLLELHAAMLLQCCTCFHVELYLGVLLQAYDQYNYLQHTLIYVAIFVFLKWCNAFCKILARHGKDDATMLQLYGIMLCRLKVWCKGRMVQS